MFGSILIIMDEKRSDIPVVHLNAYEPISDETLSIFPEGLIKRNLIIPVEKKNGRLKAVVPKADGVVKPEGLQLVAGCPVDIAIAPINEIVDFIKKHFPENKEGQSASIINLDAVDPPVNEIKVRDDLGIPNQVRELLENGLKNRASDILIEQKKDVFRFRMKVRGIWIQEGPWKNWSQANVRDLVGLVREMGEFHKDKNVCWGEVRRPFVFKDESYTITFKLSETKDMGVLSISLKHMSDHSFAPGQWGMDPQQAKEFESFLSQRRGLVLFCGPQKDCAADILCSCISEEAKKGIHVISVEKNVENYISEIDQFNAKGDPKSFNDLLKASLRHSPDLLVLNPLDQKEHFEVALRAAMQGTFVLGRYVAWDSAEALAQILAMGVDPYLVSFGLAGIVVQGSIRLNCARCQKRDPVRRDQVKDIGIPIGLQPASFFKGAGCDTCHQTGFDREAGIFEVVSISDELRGAIQPGLSASTIRSLFRPHKNIQTLRQMAIRKAIAGQTSLSEVVRVSPR